MTGFVAEPSGFFEVPYQSSRPRLRAAWADVETRPQLSHGRVVARTPTHLPTRRDFHAEDLVPAGNVGDIPLERARTADFLVLDGQRRPIEFAAISASIDGSVVMTHTGADGRARLEGMRWRSERVFVGAPGYRVREQVVGAEEGDEEPIEVLLSEGNEVEVVLLPSSGELPPGIQVEIASERPIYEVGSPHVPTWVHREIGHAQFRYGGETGGMHLCRLSPDRGRARLVSLNPAARLTLRAHWRQATLAEEDDRALRGDRQRRVELRIPDRMQVGGDVRYPDGDPVEGAVVDANLGGVERRATTDAEGAFTMDCYRPIETVDLAVRASGCLPLRRSGVPLSEAATVSLVVEPGRELVLRVVDEADRPMTTGWASVEVGQDVVHSDEEEGGVYRLTGLPIGKVPLHFKLHGRAYEVNEGTERDEVALRLPIHGRLELRVPNATGLQEDPWLHVDVSALDGSGWERREWASRGKDEFLIDPLELWPGTYEIALRQGPADDEVEVAGRLRVEIAAGETETARLSGGSWGD